MRPFFGCFVHRLSCTGPPFHGQGLLEAPAGGGCPTHVPRVESRDGTARGRWVVAPAIRRHVAFAPCLLSLPPTPSPPGTKPRSLVVAPLINMVQYVTLKIRCSRKCATPLFCSVS